jgi:signal transduction histidine kinase
LDQIPDECKKAAIEKGILKLFEGVAEQIHYMSKIINDLRDYARPIKFEPVAVDVKNLITETLSTLSIPENIKTTIDVEEKLVSIAFMADPILLKRILINLLTNAVQSMVNGGKLTVKASLADETISISVEDTGAGIPKENLGKLFEPLFTTKAKGAGLGLAVCKRLIEAHEGSITVESEVGKGSIFTIHIPFRRAT